MGDLYYAGFADAEAKFARRIEDERKMYRWLEVQHERLRADVERAQRVVRRDGVPSSGPLMEVDAILDGSLGNRRLVG